jgi:hypothetical protein
MQTTWDQLDWYRADKYLQKQLIAFVLSVLLVVLILLIPVSLKLQLQSSVTSINVELTKTQDPIPNQQVFEPPKIEPKPFQPIKENPVEVIEAVKKVQEKQPSKPKEVVIESIKEAPKQIITQPQHQLPSSVVFFESLNNGEPKLNTLGKEFQVRTKDAYDYIYQSVEQPKWNHVTKLIDEDVDKPRIEMGFYPLGFDGAVERFMDKITYKKTFTTRYGTKIGCAITIIIAGCGWK